MSYSTINSIPAMPMDPLIVDLYEGDLQVGSRKTEYGRVANPKWQTLIESGYPWVGAILKASEGTHYNSQWFTDEWPKLAKVSEERIGKDWFRGAYHYARIAEPFDVQATLFLSQIEKGGGWGKFKPWSMIDVESTHNPINASKQQVEDWIYGFASKILEATGMKPTLYGNIYLWQCGVTSHCGCDTLIVARYTDTLPPITYERIGWKYSDQHGADVPTLMGWQYCGDGQSYLQGYPSDSPIGKVDISAIVAAGGGRSGLNFLTRNR